MSYDIEVYTKTIHHEANYTSNVHDMYDLAYKENYLIIKEYTDKSWQIVNDWIDALNAERKVSLPVLGIMITEMEKYPDKYKKLNPENGWGDYEGAVKFLKDAYEIMLHNKDAVIEVDC